MCIEMLGHFPHNVRNLHHRIMSHCEKQPLKSTTGDKSETSEPKFTRNSFQGHRLYEMAPYLSYICNM